MGIALFIAFWMNYFWYFWYQSYKISYLLTEFYEGQICWKSMKIIISQKFRSKNEKSRTLNVEVIYPLEFYISPLKARKLLAASLVE